MKERVRVVDDGGEWRRRRKKRRGVGEVLGGGYQEERSALMHHYRTRVLASQTPGRVETGEVKKERKSHAISRLFVSIRARRARMLTLKGAYRLRICFTSLRHTHVCSIGFGSRDQHYTVPCQIQGYH